MTRPSNTDWFLFIGILLCCDFASKILAFLFLASNVSVQMDSLFQFALRVNRDGFGSKLHETSLSEQAPIFIRTALAYLGLSAAILATKSWRPGRRILLCGATFGLIFFAGTLFDGAFHSLDIRTAGIFVRGSTSLFWFSIFISVSSIAWKLSASLLLVHQLGNFLSFLYPPFGIIDFIYSSPFWRTFHLGIFNFADLYGLLGKACLIVAVTASVFAFVVRKRGRHSENTYSDN